MMNTSSSSDNTARPLSELASGPSAKLMDKVEGLVDRTRHLALHGPVKQTQPVDSFHASVDAQLQNIHKAVSASVPTTNYFLTTIQHDSLPAAGGEANPDPLVSLDAFRAYMKETAFSAQEPARELDLSAPISDYFISSSHNTYLTGNQLYSDAAASAYANVLLQGCRSVEIDVWDGELEKPDSSEAEITSNSSSSEGKPATSPIKEKIKSKVAGQKESQKALSRSISLKLGSMLRRKAHNGSNQDPEHEGSGTSQMPVRGEPRVLHGHTLTKGTSFREICYAIRDNAFVASDLPIIVSLEVHACLEQQQMMVDIMQEAWKGLLVEIPPDAEVEQKLPTLEQLKRKILIKTKSIPLGSSEQNTESEENTEAGQTPGDQSPAAHAHKPSKVLEDLSKMAIYTRAFHFSHFDQPEAKVPVHVFSLSEKGARDAHINHRDALFEHNRASLMRIYPFAFRVSSSNLDPSFFWRRGAQLVALNWQHLDKGMMLNHGMFNGTQGWKLKPSSHRSSEPASSAVKRQTLDLSIEVFAAQDLSLPPGNHSKKAFHPYVNCQLHAEEPDSEVRGGQDDKITDSEKSSYKQCTKSSSGRNPDFGGQKLVFPTVSGIIEALSFVRFKIKDAEIGRNHLAAWACIRLDRLRQGYRLVYLHDCTGEKSGGFLLVKITKQFS